MSFFLFLPLILYSCFGLGAKANPHDYQRLDIFALLSGTLRTYQRAGCDNDIVTLKCPSGTSISVQIAQYGKSASSHSLCNSKSTSPTLRTDIEDDTVCLLPSTIQTVIEACQKKRQCKFQTSPTTFGGDPCPGIPKYVEVAYKCRPYEFRSKVACENERVTLKCNPNSRVAVYSASYGRTQYESIQCPQPQGVPEETCLASYATETVMNLCHGKRTCELAADISTFGSPCKPQSRMYLKVVYTCVPRRVLKDQYEGPLEPDEVGHSQKDSDEFDTYDSENEYIRESAASPPGPSFNDASKNNLTEENSLVPGNSSTELHFEIQKEYIIYMGISLAIILVLSASIIAGRLLLIRHRSQKEAKFYSTSISDHTLANGFTDDISEVDADIDLQTTLPMSIPSIPSVTVHAVPISTMGTIAEVVRYPQCADYLHMHSHSHTFRGPAGPVLDSHVTPNRNMKDASTSQYYYG
ncbi:protein eva-1-like isoform X2 [Sitophilus oryzae]|uniref:Protein eva-1-like isoform X2 n=1 Tax=Sitophilus oryzae TaxID=7048 RepID=A0A6J2XDE6_SITOR|nr:protein eva-1-like isoform X2 [Sitophilus oryzae]